MHRETYMKIFITQQDLTKAGLNTELAKELLLKVDNLLKNIDNPIHAWQILSKQLLNNDYPFTVHLLFFTSLFPHWNTEPETAPACIPTSEIIASANLTKLM